MFKYLHRTQVSCFQLQMPMVSFLVQCVCVWHSFYKTATTGWANYLCSPGCLGFPEHHQPTAWYQRPPSSGRYFGDKQHNKVLKTGSKWTSLAPKLPLWDSLRFNRLSNPPWGLLLVIKTVEMEFGQLWQRDAINLMPASNPVHAIELLSKTWCAQDLAPLHQKDACKAISCTGTEEIY